ncbi:MAG: hypothetical protein GY820_37780 [Gammaproteobacteria bacterium]|nr:hypothetical protein [Gammaproteobacteria bacterium]
MNYRISLTHPADRRLLPAGRQLRKYTMTYRRRLVTVSGKFQNGKSVS